MPRGYCTDPSPSVFPTSLRPVSPLEMGVFLFVLVFFLVSFYTGFRMRYLDMIFGDTKPPKAGWFG